MRIPVLNRTAKIVILIIECLAALILTGIIFTKDHTAAPFHIERKDMYTERMKETDGQFSIEEGADRDRDSLLLGAWLPLMKPGSYSLTVVYETELEQVCRLQSDTRFYFVEANSIRLSPGRYSVNYHFWMTGESGDMYVRFYHYNGGRFVIKDIYFTETTVNLRLMLAVWLTLSLILDLCLFSSYVKAHLRDLFVILGLAAAGSILLSIDGLALGHDAGFHLARIEGIVQGLQSGQFPVRMSPFFNDDYGYPAGIYYGDLLLYFPALLRVIGFTVTTSYKLFIFLVSLMTAAAIWYVSRRLFAKRMTAGTVSLAYMTAGYRLLDIYVRSAVGEYISFIFLPFLFLGMWNLYTDDPDQKRYLSNAVPLGLGMSGLLYSHILSTEMAGTVLLVIALVFFRKSFRPKTLKALGLSVLIFLLSGLGFLVPFLSYFRSVDTVITESMKTPAMIQEYGAYFSDYFAVFRDFYGLAWGDVTDRMQLSPGLVLMGGLISAIILMVQKKAGRKIRVLVWISLALLFVSSNLFPWDFLSWNTLPGRWLAQVQFPWRFLAPAVMVLSILLGFVIDQLSDSIFSGNQLRNLTIALCLVMTCVFVSDAEDNAPETTIYDSAELIQYTSDSPNPGGTVIGGAEYLPAIADTSRLDFTVTGENAEGTATARNGIDLDLIVRASENSWIELPRFYYPNYRVTEKSGKSFPLVQGNNGRIRVLFADAYEGTVFLRYAVPLHWTAAMIISVLTAALIAAGAVIERRKKRS